MKNFCLLLLMIMMCVNINAQEIVYSGQIEGSWGPTYSNDIIVANTLLKVVGEGDRWVYYDRDTKTCSYTDLKDVGYQRSTYGYIMPPNVKKVAKGAFENYKNNIFFRVGQEIEFADGAFEGFTGYFFLGYNVIDSEPSGAPAIKTDEEPARKIEEVGRYNINGVKVQESADGQVQIILYSDGSAKKVLE